MDVLEKGVGSLDFVKVGHLLKVNSTVEQPMKAQRGSRGVTLFSL